MMDIPYINANIILLFVKICKFFCFFYLVMLKYNNPINIGLSGKPNQFYQIKYFEI